MENKQVITPKLPIKDRLSVKLGGLFALTLLSVLIGGFLWDVMASTAETRSTEAQLESQPRTVAIDPKLESDLAKVLNFEPVTANSQTKDPFTDRSNLSGQTASAVANASRSVTPVSAPQASQNQTSSATQTAQKKTTPTGNPSSKNVISSGSATPNQATTAPVVIAESPEATFERVRLWEARNRAGANEPESVVYAIGDLRPIGVVSGGTGQEEVMFFSQVMNRTISFPIGAKFFDGWLVGLRPEGVEFSNYKQNFTIVKPWGRDLKPNTANGYSLMSSPNLETQNED